MGQCTWTNKKIPLGASNISYTLELMILAAVHTKHCTENCALLTLKEGPLSFKSSPYFMGLRYITIKKIKHIYLHLYFYISSNKIIFIVKYITSGNFYSPPLPCFNIFKANIFILIA